MKKLTALVLALVMMLSMAAPAFATGEENGGTMQPSEESAPIAEPAPTEEPAPEVTEEPTAEPTVEPEVTAEPEATEEPEDLNEENGLMTMELDYFFPTSTAQIDVIVRPAMEFGNYWTPNFTASLSGTDNRDGKQLELNTRCSFEQLPAGVYTLTVTASNGTWILWTGRN